MKRRDFLKAITTGIIVGGIAPSKVLADIIKVHPITTAENYDDHIKDYLDKMHNFNKPHGGDVCLDRKKFQILKSSLKRLKRLQRTVGYGNFYLLGFDDAISVASNYSRVGPFSRAELDFLEMIFYEDGALYGFFGEKPLKNLTYRVKKQEVVKVPNNGNYIFKGQPVETYKKIKKDIGDQVSLTSGVRSVIKQFMLFLNKTYKSNGNLSMASRSLAPPGYSFHGIGDFDVGQSGFGVANFTERFTTTDVFKRLEALGYVNLRYPKNNHLGVRFEPWHIKVFPNA